MHELRITCSIIELVAEAAAGRRVHYVTVEIGKLSGVMPDAVEFCFPEIAKQAGLESATLEIQEIEAKARCQSCGLEFPTPNVLTACPCGSVRFQRLTGEELKIASIELEEAI